MLVNAYVEHRKVGWDFEDESPGRDARGFAREGASPPEGETHLVKTVRPHTARDEPHRDRQKYRRLHVIVGDANLCEVATFLKVGTTAVVLSMIEDGFIDKDLSLASPVPTMRKISHDPSCRMTFSLADGSSMTAVELQWEFFRLAEKYADEIGLESCGDEAQMAALM